MDLRFKKINKLMVIDEAHTRKDIEKRWICYCECGNVSVFPESFLVQGNIHNCGRCNKKIHRKRRRKIYNVWKSMINRCYDVYNNSYKYYGARGITVCDEWKNSFEHFLLWALRNGYSL